MMSNPAQHDAKDARDEWSRAADTDRIQLAQLLGYAAEQGRLELNDYEERLTKAYAATTYQELDRLRADLPGAPMNPRRGGTCNPAPSTTLLALLSGFERRGRWNVPKKLTTFTFWGNGVVDLRYADFTSTEVDLHAISIMGMQTILLPPEVNVEIHGRGVMGSFDHEVVGEGTKGAPKVNIRGFSLWGGVGIKRKARKAHK
ncbi:hypothetical protein BST27_25955 [Mycobacterium intermedium]|uniref:DUF1707 domain-containing protein n=2 Tax=Mycobacterium intermedium TaxID=28445 RepID=A0A1E3SHH1_MYCIE|nr:hypothetical protein BHQ20_08530 [Mycobacterium intermedium]OPE46874.1 hypothetical protein BV508_24290 [Mycobacterium intermedium]ORA96361.1 hypothetical protein BST27_25955 [Mycobacterium intermedium]